MGSQPKKTGPIWSVFLLTLWLSTPVLVSPVLADDDGLFLGFIDFRGSLGEGRHQRYVPPLSNPLFNETPYITTEIRPIYFYQDIPDDFISNGGKINLGAAEVRIALTERLGFIASKDGYVDLAFDDVLEDDNGFANISAGFKYAVISDPTTNSILTIGAEYEIPVFGGIETSGISLQGGGDGAVDVFITGAKAFDEGPFANFGFQGNAGVNIAVDNDFDTSFAHVSGHVDYEALPNLFPLFEVNVFSPIEDGTRTPGKFDGVDLVNFGSADRGTTVTLAGGVRYTLTDHLRFGAGYEAPVTENSNTIFQRRIYADLVISY